MSTLLEKLNKEELLKNVKDLKALARNFIDIDKEIPEDVLKRLGVEGSYHIIIRLIIDGKKIPKTLLINMTESNSPYYYYWQSSLAERLKYRNMKIPNILKKALENGSKLNESIIVNEKLDKEQLLKTIVDDAYSSYIIAKKLVEDGKEVPENLLKGMVEEDDNAMYYSSSIPQKYALLLINNNKEVPNIINQAIAKDMVESDSIYAVRDYIATITKAKKILPDIIVNNYNFKVDMDEKMIQQFQPYRDEVEMWYDYARSVIYYHKQNPPERLLNFLSKDPYTSQLLAAQFLIANMKVPEILIKGIMKDFHYSFWSAVDFVKNKKKVPEVFHQSIAKSIELSEKYAEFLIGKKLKVPEIIQKTLGKKTLKESVVINEKLSKEDLKYAFFKDPNITNKYARINFLEKGKEPPKEFIDSIAQSAYASFNYLESALQNKVPVSDTIKKGILKTANVALDVFDKPELSSIFSEDDLLKSIATSPHIALEIYTEYKKENKKVPTIILKSILSNENTSYDLARMFLEKNKPVSDVIIKGFISKPTAVFPFAAEALKRGFDLSEIILKVIAENADNYVGLAGFVDFEEILFSYLKQNKEIPDILLDAVNKKKSSDIAAFCMRLGKSHIKIPDKILNILIEKTPKYGVTRHLGAVSYEILSRYLTKSPESVANPEKVFKTIPTKLYQYAISPDIAGVHQTKQLIKGFLTVFGKVPEDFKKAIVDGYKEYGHDMIPKEIADAAGMNQLKTVNEKLDKDELLDVISKSPTDTRRMIFDLSEMGMNLPNKVLVTAIQKMPASALTSIATNIITFGHNEVPDIILKGILQDKDMVNRIAYVYRNHGLEIPKIIMDALSSKQKEFYNSVWFTTNKPTINEKLDKGELLGVIQKDYDGYIQIMDFYFRKKNEYPPEEFLKMATDTDEASRIFAEYCLEHKKDIPEEVIKKIAENPRSAYTIAALMILEERKVPEILIKSIYTDPLSKKHFTQFAKNQEYRFNFPTAYYAKI